MVSSIAGRIASPVVSYVDNIKLTNSKTTNALLAGGNHWWHTPGADGGTPSTGALRTLNYSFMSSASGADATGFAALQSAQQNYVRSALAYLSSIINVSFNEVGAGAGHLQFGSNAQTNSGGYARYPNDFGGGQVFLANNQSAYTANGGAWTPGTVMYETLIHEVGHGLGLKHPGNYNAGGGGTPGPYLSKAQDNRANTIMSYYDSPASKVISYSNGSFSTSTVRALGYGAFDIAALQYLYDAANVTSGTTYSWNADQRFFQTIWDPSGLSSIDLSNQTKANIVDLRAGKQSSIAMRGAYDDMPFTQSEYGALTTTVNGKSVKISSLIGRPTYTGSNNLTIAAGSRVNQVIGGSGTDTIITNAEQNTVETGNGDDKVYLSGTAAGIDGTTIDGGQGSDTLYVRKLAGHSWSFSGATLTLTKAATNTQSAQQIAQVTVQGVESIKYWNGNSLAALKATALYSPVGAPAAGAVLSRAA